MKKLILVTNFIALFLGISGIAQSDRKIINEYNDIVKVYQAKNYENASVLLEGFLQKYEGKMPNDVEYYALHLCFESFENVNNYQKALIFVNKTLNFLESGKIKLQDQNKFLSLYKEKREKFENILNPKQKEEEVVTKNEVSTKSDIQVKEEVAPKNDGKTVTLTVSGTGKTLEEAKLNALRSAIEQAFGAFISSKTEILNDNLVKDEIVSIANGNIQKYDIVSQAEIPNNGFAITLNATVSIEKLTTFAESKGVNVEYKGGLFGLKIKLQKLNEEAEVVAIKNLTSASFDILNKALDFELKVSEPVKAQYTEDEYDVKFLINVTANNNFEVFNNYFTETIKRLSLTEDEIIEYKNLNHPLHYIKIDNNIYTLRSRLSLTYLMNFFIGSQVFANSFKIFSNTGTVKFSYHEIYKSFLNRDITPWIRESNNIKNILLNAFSLDYFVNSNIKNNYQYANREGGWLYLAPKFNYLKDNFGLTKNNILYRTSTDMDDYYNFFKNFQSKHSQTGLIYFTTVNSPVISFTKRFKLSEIEKISEFKLEKVDIYDFLKNRINFMQPEPKEDWSCFLADTKIKTPTRTKNIQDIKVGDEVICFDDKGNLHTSIVESIN